MDTAAKNLTAEREIEVDYARTAALGTAAFENPSIVLSGDHLKWFYEKSFSRGATVIRLDEDGTKVGQIAMVNQLVVIDGKEEYASQLVDLFIEKSHRGKRALTMLYAEVERQFAAQKIRFAFGMPNAKAVRVNEHFFQLKPYLALQVRMGVSLPLTAAKAKTSIKFGPELKKGIVALGDRFATPSDENGLKWDGEKLFNRLCAKKFQYALHATENLLLISSPRETRGVKYTLLCGFLRNPSGKPKSADVRSVTRSACAIWGRPLFVYAGHYAALPHIPGFSLPKRIHHSPMLLQVRDFFPERSAFGMDRFQLIDFDFA
jgi:Acetyltransferase (GNAT) domain